MYVWIQVPFMSTYIHFLQSVLADPRFDHLACCAALLLSTTVTTLKEEKKLSLYK